ncbi:MAG: YiiD C-terminal domain-containing protein [Candidatus Berkiella sp.]
MISHSEVEYVLPVTSDFKAVCGKPDDKAWEHFIKVLDKKGKARIALNAKIYQSNQLAVDYHGKFVVLGV